MGLSHISSFFLYERSFFSEVKAWLNLRYVECVYHEYASLIYGYRLYIISDKIFFLALRL